MNLYLSSNARMPRGGTSISGGRGGLDLASSLEAKFGARFSQVRQIRGKISGVLLLQDAKIGKETQFWGHLGLYLKFKGQNLGPNPRPPFRSKSGQQL